MSPNNKTIVDLMDNNANNTYTAMTNNTIDVLVCLWYLLWSLPSFILYGLVVTAIGMNLNTLGPFYYLVLGLAVPDMLALLLHFAHSIPSTLLGYHLFSPTIPPEIAGWLSHLCWYMQIQFIFFIAFNRLVAVWMSKSIAFYEQMFTPKRLVLSGVGILMISAAMVTAMNLCTVFSVYNIKGYYFGMVPKNLELAHWAFLGNAIVSNFFCLVSFPIFGVTYAKMRYERFISRSKVTPGQTTYSVGMTANGAPNTVENAAELTRKRGEKKLLIQFSVVSFSLLFEQISFYIFPAILSSTQSTVVIGTAYLFFCSVNPYMYLMFNETLRKKTLQMVKK